VRSSVESTTTTRGGFLRICLLLDLSKLVSLHLEMNIKALSSVLTILYSSSHCEEAIAGGEILDEVGALMTGVVRIIIVSESHVDSVSSDRFRLRVKSCVEDLYSLFIRIDSHL